MSPGPNYSSWSNEDLVKRVSELEQQLRAQNTRYNESPSTASRAQKKQPKKAPKPFDPSRYSTRMIALKFAYLGARYNGFEHHSNNITPLPTVEEELWKALVKTRLIFPKYKEGQAEDEVCWDGCEYSKCGRTDKGVSAFGQVIGLRVRSARPRSKETIEVKANVGMETDESSDANGDGELKLEDSANQEHAQEEGVKFDPIRDELPYIQALNRVLPPDIRILAWCADPPPDFSARFNCRERRYRYFFTNPAYPPVPGSRSQGDGWLNIAVMREAAKKYEGLHDFRNFCKIDPGKQVTNFERRVFHTDVCSVDGDEVPASLIGKELLEDGETSMNAGSSTPQMYYFEVRGSAFLWHQVRHLVSLLFLIGQGYEAPEVVDKLLDTRQTPGRPVYEMASDSPLVLWDCIFPDLKEDEPSAHAADPSTHFPGYEDALKWISTGDEVGVLEPRTPLASLEGGKYGRGGIVESVWALWRKAKLDEMLAGSLLNIVAGQGTTPGPAGGVEVPEKDRAGKSARIFDGSEEARLVGPYVPLMQRARLEPPEVVNARYAARKGLDIARRKDVVDADE